MNKMTVLPSGKVYDIKSGENLRMALINNGYDIKSTCGGCASCATCVVTIVTGDNAVSDVTFEEKQLLGNVYHITKERLSCQTMIQGHLTVDIANHEQKPEPKAKTVVRKQGEEHEKQQLDPPKLKEGGFKKPRAFKYETNED
jgi:ferredoxin